MTYTEEIYELCRLNDIDGNRLDALVYDSLVIGVFRIICTEIKNNNNTWLKERIRFRDAICRNIAVRRIVDTYVGCKLTDSAYEKLENYLDAFFTMHGRRKKIPDKIKLRLLNEQDWRCPICMERITFENSNGDHKVPFIWVGDELNNNYQMLCEHCNKSKKDNVYYELAMFLRKKAISTQ